MYDLNRFLFHLKEDTKISAIYWQRLDESLEDDYFSIDFRQINSALKEWLFHNPFHISQNIYIAEVMNGFVFLSKKDGLPPSYSIYIQPDADSKICRLGLNSHGLKELYDLIEEQNYISYDKISWFIECFNNLPSHLDDGKTDESCSE